MSSEEEDSFVHVMPRGSPERGSPELNVEKIQMGIERWKERFRAPEQGCAELELPQSAAGLYKVEEQLHQNLERQMSLKNNEELSCQMAIVLAKEKNDRLRQEKQELQKKLEEMRKGVPGDDPVMVLSALPEKKMVFKGLVTNKEDMNKLTLTPVIRYPLQGGSALITFEKAEVAQRIIEAKEHMVELSYGEELDELDRCRVQVQAGPVDLLLPSALEVRLRQSSRSILVCDLPSLDISDEALLDKLELIFSKRKNGGSEVESREFLGNSNQVLLTFVEEGVAGPLIARGCIQVPIGKREYKLKISPCMSGDIADLQLQPSRCPRTVLLSGIPDVLHEETMRDTLEIHFQKASHGGGEVDALAYVPSGRHGVAVFMEDKDKN
ncbi:interferon-induced 35 kDa protein [Phaethornis superciliosus]